VNFHYWYTMWTTGTFKVTVTIPLDYRKTYLVTGGLTQTDGDRYAHVYISTVCSYSGGDQVLCGVRDFVDDSGLNLVEVVSGALSVTIALRTTGGRHRAEGAVFEI
jgi:hypothetical protein